MPRLTIRLHVIPKEEPMSNQHSPVGILDSGIGGFSVVKQVQRLMPEETVLYFGDGAHIPYGNHPQEAIVNMAQ